MTLPRTDKWTTRLAEETKRKQVIFATLTVLVDGMGGELCLQGKHFKRVYFSEDKRCYLIEHKSGYIGNACYADRDEILGDIDRWKEKNIDKFNQIMGL